MNTVRRRLLSAFIEGGGELPDGERTQGFASIVQDGLLLLTPRLRRAVELALESGEEASYQALAVELSLREGQRVTVDTVRQRLSRGARQLERWIRAQAEVSPIDGTPPQVAATGCRYRG